MKTQIWTAISPYVPVVWEKRISAGTIQSSDSCVHLNLFILEQDISEYDDIFIFFVFEPIPMFPLIHHSN